MQGCDAEVYLGSTIRGQERRIGEVGLDAHPTISNNIISLRIIGLLKGK